MLRRSLGWYDRIFHSLIYLGGILRALGIACVKALNRKKSRKKGKAGMGDDEENKGVMT